MSAGWPNSHFEPRTPDTDLAWRSPVTCVSVVMCGLSRSRSLDRLLSACLSVDLLILHPFRVLPSFSAASVSVFLSLSFPLRSTPPSPIHFYTHKGTFTSSSRRAYPPRRRWTEDKYDIYIYIYTYIHMYIYIYIYVCMYICET
jgi:hypothetical protein